MFWALSYFKKHTFVINEFVTELRISMTLFFIQTFRSSFSFPTRSKYYTVGQKKLELTEENLICVTFLTLMFDFENKCSRFFPEIFSNKFRDLQNVRRDLLACSAHKQKLISRSWNIVVMNSIFSFL